MPVYVVRQTRRFLIDANTKDEASKKALSNEYVSSTLEDEIVLEEGEIKSDTLFTYDGKNEIYKDSKFHFDSLKEIHPDLIAIQVYEDEVDMLTPTEPFSIHEFRSDSDTYQLLLTIGNEINKLRRA